MNKTHIDPKDILDGDLIRFEYAAEAFPGAVTAVEYTKSDSIPQEYTRKPGVHYLLHRPEPPYELPTEPGLYTHASKNCLLPQTVVFSLNYSGDWNDPNYPNSPASQGIREFLLEKKWPLKRLVIEE